jgi:nitroreductase
MDARTAIPTKLATRALADAARSAALAPSIHNTQPWRWRIRAGAADLHADRHRQLHETDPDGRMLITSCGAALHYACTALRALGYRPDVDRMPDPAKPDLLARVTIGDRVPPSPETVRRWGASQIRQTDRRPVTDVPPTDGVLVEFRAAAASHGIGLEVLRGDQVIELAVAVDRAQRVQVADDATRAELAAWTGKARRRATGVPDTAIPDRAGATTVPGRDFGHLGMLPGSDAHDGGARYAILYGDDDDPRTWLRAGEALSELWLIATVHGIAVVPLSAPVESPASRHDLRRLLAGVGHPHLAVRLGRPDLRLAAPLRTPRLPDSATVETAAHVVT